MVYPNLNFPKVKHRPYFYTNFVSTLDGKIQVTTPNQQDYWPIGSKIDYETLVELRAYADVLIHGKNTAMSHKTVESLGKEEFKSLRKKVGQTKDILYVVMTNNPNQQLEKQLENSNGVKYKIVGSDIKKLTSQLSKQGYKTVLVEGGPTILSSFFQHDLIDEVFLTIAPKIFGGGIGKTLTMVEGHLFQPKDVKNLKLLSTKQIDNEIFLRYKVNH